MQASDRIRTFKEFWPFYLGEHSDRTNRRLHLLGTALVLTILAAAALSGRWGALAVLPPVGYGFAWFGHFVFEKNRPATFRYPLWSLFADFKMFGHFITGTLEKEIISSQSTQKIQDS